ncbi:LuxR family transcriptional regulator [Serratia rubidaea]|uniref:LuxR family transcriptional regulator n=1 Tax=Serratia rubidaea TaxID=61652 RepID=UPI000774B597|nr:LuxR family transcriptional regulator [Serratia rubidaea]
MTQNIKITIQTTDRYLYLGLANLLQASFNNKQRNVTFLPEQQSAQADLVIQSDAGFCVQQCGKQTLTSLQQRTNRLHNKAARYRHRHRQARVCLCKRIVNFYQQCSPTPLHLLDNWLASLEDAVRPVVSCPQHMMQLTSREHEVLSDMQRELTPAEIAADLGINIKTVSHHKRNAMHKLGFSRNSELYHWLRQGGLSFNNQELM